MLGVVPRPAARWCGRLERAARLATRTRRPRPGDPPFQQPQIAGSSGGATQGFSILLILLVAAPALISSGAVVRESASPWNWIALLIGAVSGVLVLVLGARGGAASFDRRAPELLAFAVRH